MANRRMINKSISVSEQVNSLSDFAALLFTWLIPHADDYGIIPGSSKKVKALVVPMRKQTAEHVESALKEIQSASLIWRYVYKDSEYIQFCKWDTHQEGLHKRTLPKNPVFCEVNGDSENFREIPGNSGVIELNLKEEKGIGKEEKVACAPYVYLLETEHLKLIDEFGEESAAWMIEKLNNWKGANGKTKRRVNESDYLKIRNWVVDAWKKEHNTKTLRPSPDIFEEAKRRLGC